MDTTMPGKGGLELVKNFKALHRELAILVVSMHEEALYAERSFSSRFTAFELQSPPAATKLKRFCAAGSPPKAPSNRSRNSPLATSAPPSRMPTYN